MAAFSAGATFVLVEKYSAVPSGDRCKSTAPPLPNVFRYDPYVDGAAAFSERSATPPAEVMFYLNLSEQEKDAFCERLAFAC